jgi:hypothetical protein
MIKNEKKKLYLTKKLKKKNIKSKTKNIQLD